MSSDPAAAEDGGAASTAPPEAAAVAAPAAPAAPPAETWLARLMRRRVFLVILYLAFAGAYLGAAGGRLRGPSQYNHFAYLADCWLKGRLSLDRPPPNENDWARVEVLTLRDGRVVRGKFSKVGPIDRFYTLRGEMVNAPPEEIVSRSDIRYVSFPPFPAVVLLPLVAIWRLTVNDVLFNALWAAINPVLLFLFLRDLRRKGLTRRSDADNLWLVLMLGLGSVYWYCSAIGQVWYTGHVVGVTLVIGYAWASIGARRPVLAGLCVGFGFATRTPLGFMLPLFVWEAVAVTGGWKALREHLRHRSLPPGLLSRLVRFGVPAAILLVVTLVHNYARFEKATEFGHAYLNVGWQERIQRWGLFNYHFLSRNLAVALVLMPKIMAKWPWVKVSHHGMSMLVTSPNLFWTVLPGERSRLAAPLWLTVAATALPSLLYHNSGYIQFGYRFSLDYMVFLVALIAIRNRPLSWFFKALVVVAAGINLFGALTFDQNPYTYSDSFFPNGND